MSPAAISSGMMPFSIPAAADTDNVGTVTVGTSTAGIATTSGTVTGSVAVALSALLLPGGTATIGMSPPLPMLTVPAAGRAPIPPTMATSIGDDVTVAVSPPPVPTP